MLTEICVNYDSGPERRLRLPSVHAGVAVDEGRTSTLTGVRVIWNADKASGEHAQVTQILMRNICPSPIK